jgi:hypothetical protein
MFVDHDVPVLKIFLAVGQSVFRHPCAFEIGFRWKKPQYSFDSKAFSACGNTFNGDRYRPLKKPAGMCEV